MSSDLESYVVYRHLAPTGKSYIGQSKRYEGRCKDHQSSSSCRAFHAAIKKYGWDNFGHEILKDGLSLEEANYWEAHFIKLYNTVSPNGYNLTYGGNSSERSDETRRKLSEALKLHFSHKANYDSHVAYRRAETYRKKASVAAKYAHAKTEVKARHSSAVRAVRQREDSREKSRAAMQRIAADPEYRKKRSAEMKKVMANPEERKRRHERWLKTMSDPAIKEKHRVAVKIALNTEEAKSKIRANTKASWEDPEIRAKRVSKLKETRNSPEYKERMRLIRSTPGVKANSSAAQKARRERERLAKLAQDLDYV